MDSLETTGRAAPMPRHDFQIAVTFKHRVVFTRDAFGSGSEELAAILREGGGTKALVVIEEAVAAAWPDLPQSIGGFLRSCPLACGGILTMPGGEAVKADDALVREVWAGIDACGLDRHSYLLAIGGGAFLDAVGFAAATAHRGVRLLRFPTTTLSQDDSGVGVKCAINAFGRKNWLGAFAVPFAVVNDFRFLESQDPAAARDGLVEAVKVALVKDAGFFEWIETNAGALAALEPDALEECVRRSALAHARHIADGGDPFESGSSRPLDFGHWAAHKIEALSGYALSHARAVAVGIALDTTYSVRSGLAAPQVVARLLGVMSRLGLPVFHPALDIRDAAGRHEVFRGLDDFREHLGGRLTVLMIEDVGRARDVHAFDHDLLASCIDDLRNENARQVTEPHACNEAAQG